MAAPVGASTGAVSTLDVSLNASALNLKQVQPTAGSYTAQRGETLQSIARAVYGDARMWYRLADANGLAMGPDAVLLEGQTLSLPKLTLSANSVDTFQPYDPSRVTGSTRPELPDLPMPAGQDDDDDCGGMGQIIMLAVTIAVAAYTGVYLAGPETIALTATQAAAAAAAGSVAGQLTGMALGVVKDFNWTQVALSPVNAGVTAGLGGGTLIKGLDKFGSTVARAAIGNFLTQGIGVVTGLQDHFDWTSVAASAVGAGVGYGMNEALGLTLNGNPANNFSGFDKFSRAALIGVVAGTATAMARGGKVSIQQIATDAFGNALVQSLAHSPAATLLRRASGVAKSRRRARGRERLKTHGLVMGFARAVATAFDSPGMLFNRGVIRLTAASH